MCLWFVCIAFVAMVFGFGVGVVWVVVIDVGAFDLLIGGWVLVCGYVIVVLRCLEGEVLVCV